LPYSDLVGKTVELRDRMNPTITYRAKERSFERIFGCHLPEMRAASAR
jgi:hypothetical protein